MPDPFIGEVTLFAGNFAPRGWALCDGQLLSISSSQAFFSILGTTYGGDGVSTFALPDLRGRSPIHAGTGPGLSARSLGSRGGQERVTLTTPQLPSHDHDLELFEIGSGTPIDDTLGFADNSAVAGTTETETAGNSQPHDNIQRFDPNGDSMGCFGGLTQDGEAGMFNAPRGISFDPDGNLYVVDAGNARVQVFEPDGTGGRPRPCSRRTRGAAGGRWTLPSRFPGEGARSGAGDGSGIDAPPPVPGDG